MNSLARKSVMILAILVAGTFSVAQSLAQVLRKQSPQAAYSLAPGNGSVDAALAQTEMALAPASEVSSRPARLARAALTAEPIGVDALVVLGLQAQMRGEQADANRHFEYASKLSRRNLRARIWAIEQAVTEGDIRRALWNYDVALRTSRDAPRILYPVLARALAEPKVRSELRPLFARSPAWAPDFLAFAMTSGIEPKGALELLREQPATELKVNYRLKSKLVGALVAVDDYSSAWDYYKTFRDGASRYRARNPDFIKPPLWPALFDWNTPGGSAISAQIDSKRSGGIVEFSIPAGISGAIVEQMQWLPPGSYAMRGTVSFTDPPGNAEPYWELACRDGRSLGRAVSRSVGAGVRESTGRFTVPQNCPLQTLSLNAVASDRIDGVTGTATTADLRAVGTRRESP